MSYVCDIPSFVVQLEKSYKFENHKIWRWPGLLNSPLGFTKNVSSSARLDANKLLLSHAPHSWFSKQRSLKKPAALQAACLIIWGFYSWLLLCGLLTRCILHHVGNTNQKTHLHCRDFWNCCSCGGVRALFTPGVDFKMQVKGALHQFY